MGDLLVTVEVEVPKQLSDEAREALETFRKATGDTSPREDLLRRAKAG
jgi:molecular chaperone DnaJ